MLIINDLVNYITQHVSVDAVYLYGSRAKGDVHTESDWDFAVLYSDYIHDLLERVSRPQLLEAELQRKFKVYNKISVVDLEQVPLALQYNIILGKKYYDSGLSRVRRIENSILSKMEIDYFPYMLSNSYAR